MPMSISNAAKRLIYSTITIRNNDVEQQPTTELPAHLRLTLVSQPFCRNSSASIIKHLHSVSRSASVASRWWTLSLLIPRWKLIKLLRSSEWHSIYSRRCATKASFARVFFSSREHVYLRTTKASKQDHRQSHAAECRRTTSAIVHVAQTSNSTECTRHHSTAFLSNTQKWFTHGHWQHLHHRNATDAREQLDGRCDCIKYVDHVRTEQWNRGWEDESDSSASTYTLFRRPSRLTNEQNKNRWM